MSCKIIKMSYLGAFIFIEVVEQLYNETNINEHKF